MKESGIPREEIWFACRLWPTEYGAGRTLQVIDDMLRRMLLDYIGLLYVYQPVDYFVGAWKDMEKVVRPGTVCALGISNFDTNDGAWNIIMDSSIIKTAVLRIECRPYVRRLDVCQKAAGPVCRWHAGSRWAVR